MTREYLDQIVPVAANAPDCLTLSLWAGLFTSEIPASTSPYTIHVLNGQELEGITMHVV